MPRRSALLPLMALLLSGSATATTLSINAEYLGLQLGQGSQSASLDMPGVQLKARQYFADGYSSALSVTGARKSGLDYFGGHLALDKAFSAGFGYFRSGVHVGYRVLEGEGSRLSWATAGINLAFFLPITPDFDAFVAGGVGKTLQVRSNGTALSGGLYYSGSAGLSYAVGPGALNLSYQYRHYTLDSSQNLRLSSNGILLGYRFSF